MKHGVMWLVCLVNWYYWNWIRNLYSLHCCKIRFAAKRNSCNSLAPEVFNLSAGFYRLCRSSRYRWQPPEPTSVRHPVRKSTVGENAIFDPYQTWRPVRGKSRLVRPLALYIWTYRPIQTMNIAIRHLAVYIKTKVVKTCFFEKVQIFLW